MNQQTHWLLVIEYLLRPMYYNELSDTLTTSYRVSFKTYILYNEPTDTLTTTYRGSFKTYELQCTNRHTDYYS